MKHTARFLFLLTPLALGALSCGGGGGPDADNGVGAAGLSLPNAMDLIAIDAQTAGAAIAPGASINPAATFAPTSDFSTDPVQAYMWDQATEPLTMINDILTAVGQTRADTFVNTGPYLALVEAVGGGDPTANAAEGQSSAGNATALEPWLLNSTRAAGAPEIVRFWISQEDNFGPGPAILDTIFGRASVSEAPTAIHPFGDFKLDFGIVNDATSGLMQRGTLKTTDPVGTDIGFSFMMEDTQGMMGGDTKVKVQTNRTQTTGKAHMSVPDFMTGGTTDLTVAFDTNYVLRSNGTDTKLLNRNNFVRNTWGYNLYWAADGVGHTAGQRVNIAGGFPFVYTPVGGTTEYGWADYWGLWTSNPAGLPSGTTVTRDQPGGTPLSYSVLRAPGKLIRVTKRDVPLLDLDGESFEYWDWATGDQFLVQYTHATSTFSKIALRDPVSWAWVNLTTPVDLPILVSQYYGFWSEALGGSLDFVGGDTVMTVREQQIVSNDDTIFGGTNTFTLFSMTESLRAGMNATQVEIGDIFMPEILDPALAYQYTFLQNGRSLQYQGADVGLLQGAAPTSGNYMWGMQSGPMSDTDPVALGITNPWEMWNLPVYYFYETGPNEWNQYSTLLDAQGVPLQFDTPISFFYTHATANDADNNATFDGKKVFLTYGGERNLWGIPGRDADTDGDGIGDRYYPEFSLKDGTVMGPTGTEYVVKAVDMELFMQLSADPVPPALQSSLNSAANLSLPTLSTWNDPTTVAKPTVTTEPAVVAGVIQ